MLVYIIIFIILFIIEVFYLKYASLKNIRDKKFNRNTHLLTTITGGGFLFIPTIILFCFFFSREIDTNLTFFILAIIMVAIISFIDDLKPLSPQFRLAIQFIAVNIAFFGIGFFSSLSIAGILLIFGGYILAIGYTNLYNFMDGINGMTFLNALCSYITFYLINTYLIHFTNSNLIAVLIIATIVFGYFNFRKQPKCFAGDVGSITIGFTIIFFTLKLFIITKNPLVFLILGIYSLDGGWTILERLFRKENIFKPHLRHLYELFANELKTLHLIISTVYLLLQAVLNTLVYYAIKNDYNSITSFVIISICLSLIYIFTKKRIYKRIKEK